MTITGKFSSMVGTTADVVKVGLPLPPLFEVVYGPITAVGGDLSAFHAGPDTPPHRVLSYSFFADAEMVISARVTLGRAVKSGEGWS